MSNILEEYFQVNSEIKKVFYDAETEKLEKGEIQPETLLKIKQMLPKRDHVVTELAQWYLYTNNKYNARKEELKPIQEQIKKDLKVYENRLEFIKSCVVQMLPKDPLAYIANEKAYIFYLQTQKILVDNIEFLPLEYCKIETKADLRAIEKELKAGKQISGVRIHKELHPQIRTGGENALKNAQKRAMKIDEDSSFLAEEELDF